MNRKAEPKILADEWRSLLSTREHLWADVIAGARVASVAIPLSMAIALASGTGVGSGLATAGVAGLICAIAGGTPLAVSGPPAAMAVLVASVVSSIGMPGLALAMVLAGLMQILAGSLGYGRFFCFVPRPVVKGFMAGSAVTVIIEQLPRSLGASFSGVDHLAILKSIRPLVESAHFADVAIFVFTLTLLQVIARLRPSWPATFMSVGIASTLAFILDLNGKLVTEITGPTLIWPDLASLPGSWRETTLAAVPIFLIASIETLLSSTVLDQKTKREHDPNRELIGQGLGNIAASIAGGIPATGAVARSSLNVLVGAKTKRAAAIHAILVLAAWLGGAPLLARIPIATLSAVMVSFASRFVLSKEPVDLFKRAFGDGLVFLSTALGIVAFDVCNGFYIGIALALIVAALRMGRSKVIVRDLEGNVPYRISFAGALTFLSAGRILELRETAALLNSARGMVLDFEEVTFIDASCTEDLLLMIQRLGANGWRIALNGLSPTLRRILLLADSSGELAKLISDCEADTHNIIYGHAKHTMFDRLTSGVERFQERFAKYELMFDRLRSSQQPHTLFITCSDSRINPNLITSTEPGELFLVRNVGNIVSPFSEEGPGSAEGAALEFAICALGVKHIIICGHSSCGAMDSILHRTHPQNLQQVSRWLGPSKDLWRRLPENASPEDAAKQNAVEQISNVLSYPFVQRGIAEGSLSVHAWYYDISHTEVLEWDAEMKEFVPITDRIRIIIKAA